MLLKQIFLRSVLVCGTASFAAGAMADAGGATAEQATAMVKKGIAFIKANGKDKGYAEISSKASQFKDQEALQPA